METQEENMELNDVSPRLGMENGQRAQTPDQTNNEVKLEFESEFTESNEDNAIQIKFDRLTYVQLIAEALDNDPDGMLVFSDIC